MADVVTDTRPRMPTIAILEAYSRAMLALSAASRLPSDLGEREQLDVGAGKAFADLKVRIQELERDRDLLERLALMDSVTLGSRTGSPIRKWEKPRLQQAAALRGFLATLPEVPR